MSIKNWPGGVISDVPTTPSGPYQDSTASGVWTLEQQAYWEAQGLWPTAGAVNPSVFIENLFQTWLYTGNDSTQTITNGIDLEGEGGLVWIKARNESYDHRLLDTTRGLQNFLTSNDTSASTSSSPAILSSYNNNGFTLNNNFFANSSGTTFVSWAFRQQPKFFQMVTYTGDGVAGRQIAHSLGSVPGLILVKKLSGADAWYALHKDANLLILNQLTGEFSSDTTADYFGDTVNVIRPTDSVFTVAQDGGVNGSGATYVAYLFAHNAGGFGLSGEENVISCGIYTGNGVDAGQLINLGYEPQWVMIKNTDLSTEPWVMLDNMRGANGGSNPRLVANSSASEAFGTIINFNATGFTPLTVDDKINGSGHTYIYIAIRRGPMAVPTDATKVFAPVQYTTSPEGFITGFPVDFGIAGNAAGTDKWYWQSRLQGAFKLDSASTAAQVGSGSAKFDMMNGYGTGFSTSYWAEGFRRAPSFMDVVCYTPSYPTGVKHNLGVVPQFRIDKARTVTSNWNVTVDVNGLFLTGELNATNALPATTPVLNSATEFQPTFDGVPCVSYLFATCAGVSKVGSYTGTATTLQVDCGFTAGARFVLIKRTDSTGDWYVWDSARGIVAGDDPYLLLNSTAAEVTNTDYVDTYSAGFEITSTAPAAINASGGTFIFLAIA